MASNSDYVNAVSGWEIVPYFPPPLPPISMVQKDVVVVDHEQKPRRGRRENVTTLVGFSYISFHYAQHEEVEGVKGLLMSECKDTPNPNETDSSRFSAEELTLPAPAVLKGWKRETRQRVNGMRDKFYTHPLSIRKFRSLVEVVSFIRRRNNLDAPEAAPQIQDGGSLSLSGPSSFGKSKRARKYYVRKTDSGEKRIFPVVFAEDEREANKRFVENFLAESFENLMNMFSATPSGGGAVHQEQQAAVADDNDIQEDRGPKPSKRQRVDVLIRVGSDGVRHVQQDHHNASPPVVEGYSTN